MPIEVVEDWTGGIVCPVQQVDESWLFHEPEEGEEGVSLEVGA